MTDGAITDVQHVRRGSRARRIMVDDAEWRTTARSVIDHVAVKAGDTRPLDVIAAAIDEAEPAHARRRALASVSRAETTVAALTRRLCDDGFPEAVAHEVVASIASSGFVDDARYARMRATALFARGYGTPRIKRTLTTAGVPDEIAAAALAALSEGEGEQERADALAARLAPAARGSVDRLAARLVRKGYAPGIALRAARSAVHDADSPPCDLDA